MTRCLLVIMVVAVFTGCGHSHELVWPDLNAYGGSEPGEEALYVNLFWRFRPVTASGGSNRPAFSVRLPDGTVLTPDQITIARTGATEVLSDPRDAVDDRRRSAKFNYANGWLTVNFGIDGDAEQVQRVWASGRREAKEDIPGNDLAVGNPNGTKLVVLPATRDELVELFGKPMRERKSLKDLCLPPSC